MATFPTTPATILAAIDYSEASPLVVQQAVEIARQKDAGELHFLHVNPRSPEGDEEGREARQAELQEWLDARLQGPDGVPYTVRVVAHAASGDPGSVILEMASDLLADMVVVGTHGRKGMQRLIMGSVAESVVRHCGCPVLVIRPKVHDQAIPQIAPPCPRCVETRVETKGATLWCEQHSEKHGRRHTYYNTRLNTWVSQRMMG
jgi:nucleotide-binding universal stress UspA family protein